MKPYTDIEQSRLSTMTQEEKAKRYDEALKMAKEQHQYHQYPARRRVIFPSTIKDVLEYLFPELRESDDEKIRKALIDFFNRGAENGEETNGVYDKDILAWLEKQGEQKPDDKFEPKFKVGDWVVQENIGVYKVIEICESWYEVVDGEDSHYSISFDKEYMCRLWDIAKDAKDGDILAYDGKDCPFIYRTKTVFGNPVAYCGVRSDGLFISESPEDHQWCLKSEVQPATKKQRDLLFQKMKESGYEFDFDKKELKKIEDKPTPIIEFYDPYEAVVKSIAEMCKRYDRMNLDSLQDFYDNVKVKCKDAQEYVSLYSQNAKE